MGALLFWLLLLVLAPAAYAVNRYPDHPWAIWGSLVGGHLFIALLLAQPGAPSGYTIALIGFAVLGMARTTRPWWQNSRPAIRLRSK